VKSRSLKNQQNTGAKETTENKNQTRKIKKREELGTARFYLNRLPITWKVVSPGTKRGLYQAQRKKPFSSENLKGRKRSARGFTSRSAKPLKGAHESTKRKKGTAPQTFRA